MIPMSMVRYKSDRKDRRSGIQLFVSKTEFDRSMSQLADAANNIRTVIFPNTVR